MNSIETHVLQFVAIVVGALISEDATSVSVGLLVRDGRVPVWLGLLACFLGIFVGDLAVWLLGRMTGPRCVRFGWLRPNVTTSKLDELGRWFDHRASWSVIASRFLPGTRVPLYFAVGALGSRPGKFVAWSFVAALIWTPLVVLGVAAAGRPVQSIMQLTSGTGLVGPVLAGAAVVFLARSGARGLSVQRRARFTASVSRIWRWEFWPTWLFYLPLVPYLAWLVLRHRSCTVWTAANPAIPHGGVVGESKVAILDQLPVEWVVPTALIPMGDVPARCDAVHRQLTNRNWSFPLILKPDASQRGAGVRRIDSMDAVATYFAHNRVPIVAQTYHAGPYEAGVFYYRFPDEPRGRIFSITDKRFPKVIGDGIHSLEQLIWQDPRHRMQAAVFLSRHAMRRDHVPAAGEVFTLALAGNHCQGAMFLDGAHLLTAALEDAIDRIARHAPGFYFGRFDIRYADPDEFRAGRGFAIVELNGVTSESTNIYDPARSLLAAYRTLGRQWKIAFQIGNANRARGIQSLGVLGIVQLVCRHRRQNAASPLSD